MVRMLAFYVALRHVSVRPRCGTLGGIARLGCRLSIVVWVRTGSTGLALVVRIVFLAQFRLVSETDRRARSYIVVVGLALSVGTPVPRLAWGRNPRVP